MPAKPNGKRYRVLAVQLNRITRETMNERASDREVEYLAQGTVVDDFTDAEAARYTAGTHPGIVEVDDDGLPVAAPVEQPRPQPSVPVAPQLTDPDMVPATELGDIELVANDVRETDGVPVDPSQDRGKLVVDGTPAVDATPAPGPVDQRPTDVRPAKATKATKAAAKTVHRGGVNAGNIGEADVKDDDAPQF